MQKKTWARGVLALLWLPLVASAQEIPREVSPARQNEGDLLMLKKEIEALKKDYEARLEALEARLRAAEDRAQASEAKASEASDMVRLAGRQTQALLASPVISNPALGVVLSGSYGHFSQNPSDRLSGFWAKEEEILGHDRGFSLMESEVMAEASIDPYFSGHLMLAFDENDVKVEEGYIDTLSLPAGFGLRFGRFFSSLGYLNEKHPHAWNFIDAPLPYRAFFGGANFGDDGVRATWVAPTPWLLEANAEVFRGGHFPAYASDNGAGNIVLALHTGADLGESVFWRAGFSRLWARARDREVRLDEPLGQDDLEERLSPSPSFWGKNRVNVLDATLKWQPKGPGRAPDLALSGEYFWGREKGEYRGDAVTDVNDGAQGWWLEAAGRVWGRWRTGMRYDTVFRDNSPIFAALGDERRRPWRISTMVEFVPSEFSRLRWQYNRDHVEESAGDYFWLQYIMSLGAHGAHGF